MNRSLRIRLLLGGAAWILVALAVTGFVIILLFNASARRHMQGELALDLNRLVAQIEPSPGAPSLAAGLPDARYAVPFGGMYWQVLGPGGDVKSRSLWDQKLITPAGTTGLADFPGPAGEPAVGITREAVFDAPDRARSYSVTVASDRRYLDDETMAFANDLIPALLVLAAALIGATWLQVELGLRPLRGLRLALQGVRDGTEPRLKQDQPVELLPLVGEVNDLLDARDTMVQSARARAADLVHGLKTPLAALMATANRMTREGQAERAETIRELAEQMSQRVDYQLRLSRLRPATGGVAITGSINSVLVRAISVLRKTARGEDLHWRAEFANDASVRIDQHDLFELVGVLLENATKWAQSRVDISTALNNGLLTAIIEDDGPGLSEADMTALGVRGQRFDEAVPGSGLGLAIATEILGVNEGTIAFSRSDLGGLKVCFTLTPGHTPPARADDEASAVRDR